MLGSLDVKWVALTLLPGHQLSNLMLSLNRLGILLKLRCEHPVESYRDNHIGFAVVEHLG
uniref:Tail tube B n=1 Tax=uncultured marine virus TaxID=186617 RepID=A0A0F7L8I0_9VIRU|nr:tail tube B [uncultured marine virus]